MKSYLKAVLLALVMCSVVGPALGDNNKMDFGLPNLYQSLSEQYPDRIIGFEEMSALNCKLGLLPDIRKTKIEEINRIIASRTDYELVATPQSLIIQPKNISANNDTPLCDRIVTIPGGKNVLPSELIAKLREETETVKINVAGGRDKNIDKPISFNGMTKAKLGDVLTSLAVQMGARKWQILHYAISIDGVPPHRPYKLGIATVEFSK